MVDPGGGGENNEQTNSQEGFIQQRGKKRTYKEPENGTKKHCGAPHGTPQKPGKPKRTTYPTQNRYSKEDPGPEYFILMCTTDDSPFKLGKYNPQALCRQLKGAGVPYKELYSLGQSTIKLAFNTADDANNFLESTYATNRDYISYIPSSRIKREGVIRGLALDTTKEEILSYTESKYEILDAINLCRRTDKGEWTPTSCWRIIFKGQELPKKVAVMGYIRTIHPYVRPVLKCHNCQRFGHTAKECVDNTLRCSHCGNEANHPASECPKPEDYCLHCQTTGHNSNDTSKCPTWKKQKKIKATMATKNLSYAEASKYKKDEIKKPQRDNQAIPKAHEFPSLPSKRNKEQTLQTITKGSGEQILIPANVFETLRTLLAKMFHKLAQSLRDTESFNEEQIFEEFDQHFQIEPEAETTNTSKGPTNENGTHKPTGQNNTPQTSQSNISYASQNHATHANHGNIPPSSQTSTPTGIQKNKRYVPGKDTPLSPDKRNQGEPMDIDNLKDNGPNQNQDE